jgi:enamine deaminase RidA (YjgF/YER057c/UK114 family)
MEHGLAPYDGKIEINVLAVRPDGAAKKRHIDAGIATTFQYQPQAVGAGDLLFMCGMMAVDEDGLVEAARAHPRQPWFSSRAEAQAECIIDNVATLCKAAGTSLLNVVRIQQFHTDLAEFFPAYKVWERRLGGRPLPFSAVEVPSPLPVPEATVLMDVWAYVP